MRPCCASTCAILEIFSEKLKSNVCSSQDRAGVVPGLLLGGGTIGYVPRVSPVAPGRDASIFRSSVLHELKIHLQATNRGR